MLDLISPDLHFALMPPGFTTSAEAVLKARSPATLHLLLPLQARLY